MRTPNPTARYIHIAPKTTKPAEDASAWSVAPSGSRKTGVVWKRRYALLGWLVWKYWKRRARSKLPRR
jgi:hypothetical protein